MTNAQTTRAEKIRMNTKEDPNMTNDLLTALRNLKARRAAAVEAAVFATDDQTSNNAAAEVHWIDQEIVRIALQIAEA
jgi:hypothetical protein